MFLDFNRRPQLNQSWRRGNLPGNMTNENETQYERHDERKRNTMTPHLNVGYKQAQWDDAYNDF